MENKVLPSPAEWREAHGCKTKYHLVNPADRECSPELPDNFFLSPDELDDLLRAYGADTLKAAADALAEESSHMPIWRRKQIEYASSRVRSLVL